MPGAEAVSGMHLRGPAAQDCCVCHQAKEMANSACIMCILCRAQGAAAHEVRLLHSTLHEQHRLAFV